MADHVNIFRIVDDCVEACYICGPCSKKEVVMIQFNSTFFIPVDKIDAATACLKDNYLSEIKKCCGEGNVMLGRLLTAVEEDHAGLTVTARFATEADAEVWDAKNGSLLRMQMGQALKLVQVLHFSSMIEIISL